MWEEVAALDLRRLAASTQAGQWLPETMAALASFESREKTTALKVSRLESET